INEQESIDFIWSCCNQISGGFIGRPYATRPDNEYRISTMDNTYFALTTLDLLMDNWVGYETQKSDTIDYINSLQQSSSWEFGGFWNDLDKGANSFDSLEYFASEPNIFSSYYCVKSLELFGMESSINVPNFLDYLDALYNEDSGFSGDLYFVPGFRATRTFLNLTKANSLKDSGKFKQSKILDISILAFSKTDFSLFLMD
ncbi:unnamed protein product, partial [marine sediment metagenome]